MLTAEKSIESNPVVTYGSGVRMRFALPADADQIMALLVLMGKENAIFAPDMDDARATVDGILKSEACIVVEKNGRLIAAVALYVTNWWYNRKRKYMSDYFFFVHPKHRSYQLAKSLVDECKKAARVVGIPLVLGIMVKKDPIRKLKFFQRQMTPLGGFFISGL